MTYRPTVDQMITDALDRGHGRDDMLATLRKRAQSLGDQFARATTAPDGDLPWLLEEAQRLRELYRAVLDRSMADPS